MVNNDVLGHFFAVFGNLFIHLNLIRVIASNLEHIDGYLINYKEPVRISSNGLKFV